MLQAEGCERQVGKCRPDSGSESCGPFQIKRPYWTDCGKPGGGGRKKFLSHIRMQSYAEGHVGVSILSVRLSVRR